MLASRRADHFGHDPPKPVTLAAERDVLAARVTRAPWSWVVTTLSLAVVAIAATHGLMVTRQLLGSQYRALTRAEFDAYACLAGQLATRVPDHTVVYVDEPPSEAQQRLVELSTPRLRVVPGPRPGATTLRLVISPADALPGDCFGRRLIVLPPAGQG